MWSKTTLFDNYIIQRISHNGRRTYNNENKTATDYTSARYDCRYHYTIQQY